jgi:hypothetical protein
LIVHLWVGAVIEDDDRAVLLAAGAVLEGGLGTRTHLEVALEVPAISKSLLKSLAALCLPNHTNRPRSSIIIGPCSPAPSFTATKTYPGAVSSCAWVVTWTAAGLRSGRERKAHTPFGGTVEMFGSSQTFGVRKRLTFGLCKDLSFEVRSSRSQPIVCVNAR